MFCWRSRALSKEIQASSPARLRLSSVRRSLVCAPLTEGERTDAVASRWCWDDRGLDVVEVQCAMPSSRSTSSRHCFMASDEAVELGGWHSNSLAADNAPGTALDGVRDTCAGVCCRTACTAAAPDTGRLDTRGMEDTSSSSTTKSSEVSARCSTICTIILMIQMMNSQMICKETSKSAGRTIHLVEHDNSDDEFADVYTVELVRPTKAKPSACSSLQPVQKNQQEVKFTFNVAKCDRIFDEL
jgi:hypothetical protein